MKRLIGLAVLGLSLAAIGPAMAQPRPSDGPGDDVKRIEAELDKARAHLKELEAKLSKAKERVKESESRRRPTPAGRDRFGPPSRGQERWARPGHGPQGRGPQGWGPPSRGPQGWGQFPFGGRSGFGGMAGRGGFPMPPFGGGFERGRSSNHGDIERKLDRLMQELESMRREVCSWRR